MSAVPVSRHHHPRLRLQYLFQNFVKTGDPADGLHHLPQVLGQAHRDTSAGFRAPRSTGPGRRRAARRWQTRKDAEGAHRAPSVRGAPPALAH